MGEREQDPWLSSPLPGIYRGLGLVLLAIGTKFALTIHPGGPGPVSVFPPTMAGAAFLAAGGVFLFLLFAPPRFFSILARRMASHAP